MAFKKGNIPWNKGKKGLQVAWNKGKSGIYTKEQLKKMSESSKGNIPWNKGYGDYMKGEKNSFYGKKHSEETKKKMSLLKIGKENSLKGIPRSKETIQKMSDSAKGKHSSPKTEFKKGQLSPKKGKTFETLYGKERAIKMKKLIKERRARQVFPIKDTSIEIKIQNFLTKLHLEYFTHKYISGITNSYQCDIFIPKQETEGVIINKKTIIECDGCFWHCCPICRQKDKKNEWQLKQKEKDKLRTKELIQKGFRVLRLWEHEIRPMKINDFQEKLNEI